MLQEKELIIWDFDGVIIDSDASIKKTYNTACLEVLGHKNFPPFEEFASMMGEALPKMLEKLGLPVEQLEPVYLKYALEFQNEILLFEKVKEILIKLNQNGKKVALVTGKNRMRVEKIFDQFYLHSYFCQVITCSDVQNSKPDPEGILQVIKDQNASKEKSVYIGDAPNDILAARNAGIEVIAVGWGICKKDDLLVLSPDYFVEKEEDLKSLFFGL